MKRWIWFVVSILISTGVYFTIRYGLRPKPIPVLNPTEFTEAPQIGAVVYKRLRQEIRAEEVMLLGSTSELQDYQEVWAGLLKTALANQVKVDVIFQREGLQSPLGDLIEVIPFSEGMIHSGDLVNLVKARMRAGHLVVIHGATLAVSHLIKDSLSRGIDAASQRPVLSISVLALSLKPEEQDALQTQCLSVETDYNMRIECAEARVGKALLKKKILPGKIWAVMERHGLKEYLIFVHR